jgi:hypothetical protein
VARSATRTSLAAAAALVLLLGLLATLQYRWIGEIRDAERERMRASSRAVAAAMAADLDRELARALRFFMEPLRSEAGAAEIERGLSEAWSRWTSEARVPSLLAGVELVRRDANGEWGVERLDPSARTLARSDWTAELAPIRRTLEEEPDRRPGFPPPPPPGPPPRSSPRVPPRMLFFRAFDRPPTLVVGNVETPPPGEAGRPSPILAALLRLDAAALSERLLPELVARHFGDSAPYDVAVVRRSGGAPLYRSRADFDPDRRPPDASVGIFPAPFGRFGPESDRPPRPSPQGPPADFLLRVRPDGGAPPPWTLVVSPSAAPFSRCFWPPAGCSSPPRTGPRVSHASRSNSSRASRTSSGRRWPRSARPGRTSPTASSRTPGGCGRTGIWFSGRDVDCRR